jgi:hypothetical protein
MAIVVNKLQQRISVTLKSGRSIALFTGAREEVPDDELKSDDVDAKIAAKTIAVFYEKKKKTESNVVTSEQTPAKKSKDSTQDKPTQ